MFNSNLSINPTFAVLLSLIIPGLGQLAVGYEKRGLFFLFPYFFLWLGIKAFENDYIILSFLLAIIMIILSFYAAYDAYKLSKEKIAYDSNKNSFERFNG